MLCFARLCFARLCNGSYAHDAEQHLMHCECNAAAGEGLGVASKAQGSAELLWTSRVRSPAMPCGRRAAIRRVQELHALL